MNSCLQCDLQLESPLRKFCSRSCAAKYNNHKSPKRKKLLNGKCRICYTAISKRQAFCSSECKSESKRRSEERRKIARKRNVIAWRRRTKMSAIDYKGGRCQVCGYHRCVDALEFHHLDPAKKDFAISNNGGCRSWESVKAELDKCALLCCRCHREVHAELISL